MSDTSLAALVATVKTGARIAWTHPTTGAVAMASPQARAVRLDLGQDIPPEVQPLAQETWRKLGLVGFDGNTAITAGIKGDRWQCLANSTLHYSSVLPPTSWCSSPSHQQVAIADYEETPGAPRQNGGIAIFSRGQLLHVLQPGSPDGAPRSVAVCGPHPYGVMAIVDNRLLLIVIKGGWSPAAEATV